MENKHNENEIKDNGHDNIPLKKLNNKRLYSSLYRCKTNQQIPFFSKNSPIQPSYFNQKPPHINDKRLQYASMSKKDSDKDNSVKKIKQNKTFKIFNSFKHTISKISKDILNQYKTDICEKNFQSNKIKDNVNILTYRLIKSNEEYDMTKEASCLIKTNSLQLSNNCHRILLENGELDYELNKLKEENENVK